MVGTADLIAAFNDGRRLKRGAPSLLLLLPSFFSFPSFPFLLLLLSIPPPPDPPFNSHSPDPQTPSPPRLHSRPSLLPPPPLPIPLRARSTDGQGSVEVRSGVMQAATPPYPPSPRPPYQPYHLLLICSPTLSSSVIVMSGGLDSSLSSVDVSISTPTTLCPYSPPPPSPGPI